MQKLPLPKGFVKDDAQDWIWVPGEQIQLRKDLASKFGRRPPNCQKFCYNKFFYVMFFIRETEWGTIEHLMIARLNGDRIPDHWKTLQRIKNEVVGDRLAIEIYPPTSELVDECNAYHLWVLPKDFRLPFGLTYGWINSNQNEVKNECK